MLTTTNLLIRADGTTQIGSSLILSCEYVEQVNTSDDVSFGCAAASCITVEVKGNLTSAVNAGEALTYYQVDDSGNRTLIGKFYVDKPTIASKSSYKFEAYDAVSKLDKDLSEWLYGLNTDESFPYSLKTFAQMVCSQCGLTFSTTSFLNDTYSVKAFYSDHITGRDLMGLVAELAGGYIRATTSGAIIISWYTANLSVQIAPTASGGASGVTRIPYFSGELSFEKYITAQIQRVQIHGDEADIGAIYPTSATGVTYEVSNNILLANATQTELLTVAENLYNRIHTFQYRPCTVKVPRNSLLHAGEIINVVDANGNTFSTIIMKLTFSPDGVSIESTGNKSRDSTAGVASRKYENIFGKMLTVDMSVEGLKLEATALDGRMTTIEVTVDGLSTQVGTLEETYSIVKQTADKIEWVVASGTSSSDFVLTDRTTSLITGTLSLEANGGEYSGELSVVPYGFSLGSDGYYTSGSVSSGTYALCRIDVSASEDCILTLDCINYSNTNYYGLIGKIDETLNKSGNDDASIILKSFANQSSTDPVKVEVPIPSGSHYFFVKFKTGGSAYGGYFKFKQGISRGDTATITLKSGSASISSASITFNGLVTFNDLAQAGSTIINGSNITTGTINAIDIWGSKFGAINGSNRAYMLMTALNDLYVTQFKINDTFCASFMFSESYFSIGFPNRNAITLSLSGNTFGDSLVNTVIVGSPIYLTPYARDDYAIECQPGYFNPKYPYDYGYPTYLGHPLCRWAGVYAETGVIMTSDRTKKKNINYDDMSDYLSLFDELKPVSFQYIKGTSGRTHIGFISQDVEESIEKLGMSSLDFAGFCKDHDEDSNLDIYALRYSEFIALNTMAIKRLEKRLEDIIGGKNNDIT